MNTLTTAFLAVLDVTWRASCLILLVYALRPLLRAHLPARLVFVAWIAVTLRLLLPFALPTAWSPFNLTALRSQAAVSAPQARPVLTPLSDAPLAIDLLPHAPPSLWQRATALAPLQWLSLVWAFGVLALVSARLGTWWRFTRQLRRDHAAQPDLFEATETGRFEIVVTDAVRAPALHGIFRPRLLFPRAFRDGLTTDELRLTVAHELAHARRRDLLVQALLHAAAILHWFNPLAWLAVRSARHDCELACDESVLRRLPDTEHAAYGATLMKIVSLAHRGLTPPRFGLGVVETKQHLKRRIEMIIAHPSSTPARTLLGAALLASLTLASLTRELPAQSPAVNSPPTATSAPTSATPGIRRLDSTALRPAQPAMEPMVTFTPAPVGQADRLDAIYPGGTVATIGDRTITLVEVRREMEALLPSLRANSTGAESYEQKLSRLQDSVIKDLIDRAMLIQEFHRVPADGQARHIADGVVDREIAEITRDQFDNDREKLLAYLRTRSMTLAEFRKETEDSIAFRYMKRQQNARTAQARAAQKAAQEEAIRNADPRGSVHLRMIQLNRAAGETDDTLRARAKVVLDRFQAGEKFEALAREFSQDKRRERGGDWGWLYPSDIKASFADAIFTLKAGEAGAPIITPEAGLVFYVEEKK